MKDDLTKLLGLDKRRRCDCALCKRGRKFYRITAALPKQQREWIRAVYNNLMDAECEVEMYRAQPRKAS